VVRPLIPEDHIAYLADPARVVDVIFGILARETGRISDFRKEIEGRQTADQVKTVYRALKTIHSIAGTSAKPSAPALPEVSMTGKSTMHKPTMGKKSKGLLG
jgi:HPt (histidine-containing phosphotransfer) domain-containing protein